MLRANVVSDLSRIYQPACGFTYSPQGSPSMISQVVPRTPVVICAIPKHGQVLLCRADRT